MEATCELTSEGLVGGSQVEEARRAAQREGSAGLVVEKTGLVH